MFSSIRARVMATPLHLAVTSSHSPTAGSNRERRPGESCRLSLGNAFECRVKFFSLQKKPPLTVRCSQPRASRQASPLGNNSPMGGAIRCNAQAACIRFLPIPHLAESHEWANRGLPSSSQCRTGRPSLRRSIGSELCGRSSELDVRSFLLRVPSSEPDAWSIFLGCAESRARRVEFFSRACRVQSSTRGVFFSGVPSSEPDARSFLLGARSPELGSRCSEPHAPRFAPLRGTSRPTPQYAAH